MSSDPFEGQVAAVTGGARGIGAATALRMVEAGAAVALRDLRGAEDPAAAMPSPALGVAVAVCDEAAVEAARDAMRTSFGRVDVLADRGGLHRSGAAAARASVRALEAGDRHPFRRRVPARAVLDDMLARDCGRIVAALAGAEGDPNSIGHSAAKPGIIG